MPDEGFSELLDGFFELEGFDVLEEEACEAFGSDGPGLCELSSEETASLATVSSEELLEEVICVEGVGAVGAELCSGTTGVRK